MERERYILSIQSDLMNERVVGPLEPPKVLSNRFWITWSVHYCYDFRFGCETNESGSDQVYSKNQVRDPALPPLEKGQRPVIPLERVIGLVTDAFTGATERHIEVGDGLEMFIIEKGKGVRIVSKGVSYHFRLMSYLLLCDGTLTRTIECRSRFEARLISFLVIYVCLVVSSLHCTTFVDS